MLSSRPILFEIDKALAENPDVAFICNPSSLHMETTMKIAEKQHKAAHYYT